MMKTAQDYIDQAQALEADYLRRSINDHLEKGVPIESLAILVDITYDQTSPSSVAGEMWVKSITSSVVVLPGLPKVAK